MATEGNLRETIKQRYRVDRRKIAFLRFIIEAYDGLAILTTLDSETGLVELQIAPDCVRDLGALLEDLKHEILMEKVGN